MHQKDTPPRVTVRDDVQGMLDTAIGACLAAKMTSLAFAGHPGALLSTLHWTAQFDVEGRVRKVAGTVPADVDEGDVPSVLADWVKAFRFTPTQIIDQGTMRYTGVVDELIVSLSGVVDRVTAQLAPRLGSTDTTTERNEP